MLDFSHPTGVPETHVITGTTQAVGTDWVAWHKPRGKTMIDILLFGKGANGGLGAVGANSNAAGGAGGGSGSQTRLTMPLCFLPDVLYFSLIGQGPASALASYVAIAMPLSNSTIVSSNILMIANGGTVGGDAVGAVAGVGGPAGVIATAATMPLGWAYASALTGATGGTGGTTAAGLNYTLSATGLLVSAGTGGGGLPAAAVAGTYGGSLVPGGVFPNHTGGAAYASATTPPGNGNGGYYPIPKLLTAYSGTGGASTHGTATGAGLYASIGGNGAPGCGGGGNGGSLTGTPPNVAGVVGLGGPAIAFINCW